MNIAIRKNAIGTTASKTGFALLLVATLFFLWGFSNILNLILIPHLKKLFARSTVQSTLVDVAVYIACFLMAIPAVYVMKKFGYKLGILTGILFFFNRSIFIYSGSAMVV